MPESLELVARVRNEAERLLGVEGPLYAQAQFRFTEGEFFASGFVAAALLHVTRKPRVGPATDGGHGLHTRPKRLRSAPSTRRDHNGHL